MKKNKYKINGLDCANCARKLEESLNKQNDMKNVRVNFNTSIISYESNTNISIKELNNRIKTIEPECNITNINEEYAHKDYTYIYLIIGFFLGIISTIFIKNNTIKIILIIISNILLLHNIFIKALKKMTKNKTIDENMLMTISCIGAFFLGEYLEGIMVSSLYLLGEILEHKAINKSRNEVSNIINIKQDFANRKANGNIEKIAVEEVKAGDILVIKKGEKIPVDGIVIKGNTLLDTSSLTGESKLLNVKENDKVLSGSINNKDIIEIKATNIYEDSTVNRILSLISEATDKKARKETYISKISKIYTPIVIILAILVLIFLPILFNISYEQSLYRALTFLVISCPCAIAISVPLSYFTGIGISSSNGILIKGSNYLDLLGSIDGIIFDKTGTITTGEFNIKNINIIDKSYTKEEIIKILVSGESYSNHPIANSILKLSKDKIDNKKITNYKEESGSGISFKYDNKNIKIGNKKLCDCDIVTDLHLSIDNVHIASIELDNGIKENVKEVINEFKRRNIITYMFTGDKNDIAKDIGNKLGIENIYGEMLPDNKYKEYEKIKNDNNIIAFVGDGINDAPVLKRADIGISMGNIGSSAAIEASDIVITNDDLEKILLGIDISKYTNHIIKQNLIFALLVKIIILLLSVIGIASMWFAVFADTGVTLLTILNSLRIMRKYK